MLNKIFVAVLAAAILAMGILLYLSYSWLQSITAPGDVVEYYKYYANISWIFLLISSLLLLVIGNIVLWMRRRAWAMWAALIYFSVFTIAHKFWLDRAFFNFQQANNLTDSFFSFGALAGILLIVMAAIIVFFNQYLMKRLFDKMYLPVELPVENLPETTRENEDNV